MTSPNSSGGSGASRNFGALRLPMQATSHRLRKLYDLKSSSTVRLSLTPRLSVFRPGIDTAPENLQGASARRADENWRLLFSRPIRDPEPRRTPRCLPSMAFLMPAARSQKTGSRKACCAATSRVRGGWAAARSWQPVGCSCRWSLQWTAAESSALQNVAGRQGGDGQLPGNSSAKRQPQPRSGAQRASRRTSSISPSACATTRGG